MVSPHQKEKTKEETKDPFIFIVSISVASLLGIMVYWLSIIG